MRILVINYEFPPLGGGAGNVAAHIARHVASQGVKVAILTSHFKGLPRQEVIDGYQVHRVPVLRHHVYKCSIYEMFSFVANSIVPSWRLARRFRPDLVHIHSGFPTGPLGYWLKVTQGIPYIMTLHGGEVPGFLPEEVGTLHKILAPATRVVWNAASAVIAVSDGLRDLSLQAIPAVDIQVIPNGVDCGYFAPAPTCREPDDPFRMLFVGRVVRQKGLSYLLDALGTVKARGTTDWQLRIVGDGPMRPHLEAQAAQRDIADLVEFTGWLPFEQIPDEMRSANLFVLPSIIEGMPLVLLQAMACGLPVVATQVSGSVDLVQPGDCTWDGLERDCAILFRTLPGRALQPQSENIRMQGLRARWNRFANARAGTVDYFTLTSSHHSLTQALLPLIDRHATGRILDIGAGFGTYRAVLERCGDSYIGVDTQLYNATLDILADGRQLPFASNQFDTIFCSQVLEHTPQPWQLLDEAYRVLCPGGVLILSVPHLSYSHAAPEDYYRYTSYGLVFLLRQAGFERIEVQPAGGIFSLVGGMLQSVCLASLPARPARLVDIVLFFNRYLSRLLATTDDVVDRNRLLVLNYVAVTAKP